MVILLGVELERSAINDWESDRELFDCERVVFLKTLRTMKFHTVTIIVGVAVGKFTNVSALEPFLVAPLSTEVILEGSRAIQPCSERQSRRQLCVMGETVSCV